MFEGVSDQLHQFISPRTSSIPLNFALHSSNSPLNNYNFHPFDGFNGGHHNHHHQIPLPPHHILQPLHLQTHKNGDEKDDSSNVLQQDLAMDLEVGRERPLMEHTPDDHHQWSHDEVLALLRIRSHMDNWFPDSPWDHVSRKLGEVGFRRTAEKCKEKFEQETRFFNSNKTTRFPTHHYQHDQVLAQTEQEKEEQHKEEDSTALKTSPKVAETTQYSESCMKKKKKKSKKKRKTKEFELLKDFCEDIVKKMILQQEEIHSKLLQDMLKREEEKVAKEESWKKQQMERLHKELELMAQEQAIAGDRQATIIEILNQITNSTNFPSLEARKELKTLLQTLNNANSTTTHENSSSFTTQNDSKSPNCPKPVAAPSPSIKNHENPPNPCSDSIQKPTQNPKSSCEKELSDDLGKRWPRDEVLALVNVRCNLYGNGGDQESAGEGSSRAPLWERISQGMLELGYKRSAKRCKEKWENINKYFRKTRDVNKKRSLDSRTCPYFHQLSTLYNQGGKRPENCLNSSENQSDLSENLPNSSQRSSADTAT